MANIIAILLIIQFWKVHMIHGWFGLIPNIIGTCTAVGSIDCLLQSKVMEEHLSVMPFYL